MPTVRYLSEDENNNGIIAMGFALLIVILAIIIAISPPTPEKPTATPMIPTASPPSSVF